MAASPGQGKDPLQGHVSGQSNEPMSRPAHALSSRAVVAELQSDPQSGLSDADAGERLQKYGANDLGESEGAAPWSILVAQVANAMTLVLIMAMAVSFGIQSWIEGGVIAAVILLNIVVGFFQEFSAAKTMDSLRSLSSPTANVVRGGDARVVPSGEVVVGDLVELKTGDTVPADIRIVDSLNFETDEALLTGESLPVAKDAGAVFEDATGPGDRLNVAYSSSTVVKGRARGIVFATGTHTEIGAIAAALRHKDSRRRPVKGRNKADGGRPGPHRYVEAYTLTATDAIGRFLGVNVGTPLQKKLSRLAVLLFAVAVICAIIVLAANGFSGQQAVVIYAVATGLSMIPASLTVVLTITMAAGTKRMVRRNVVVRNLKSLEALGAVTDICSDKTGTLTQGKMVARRAWIPALGTVSVDLSSASGGPFDPTSASLELDPRQPADMQGAGADKEKGEPKGVLGAEAATTTQLQPDSPSSSPALADYLRVASFANLATVFQKDGVWHARGDPTEIAIQVLASRFGWNRSRFVHSGSDDDEEDDAAAAVASPSASAHEWTEVTELPFDSDVKRMSVVLRHTPTGALHVFTKGAVERVIDTCVDYRARDGGDDDDVEQKSTPVTDDFRGQVFRNVEALASGGLRVLALASKRLEGGGGGGDLRKGDAVDRAVIECGLTFRGLVGLYDPPRPESAPAVRSCHGAGIAVHMLTGDHPGTAQAVAAEIGILPGARAMSMIRSEVADCLVMTASRFDALSDDEVDELPVLPLVIARCAPNTKVRMIEALHRRKKFCAMTGDGVNDSPSLRRADVGIAMGLAGSDVAKEASDVVLADDNFASIVAAIEEGRRVFDNIQKFILHVLAENIAQACTLLVGLAFKDRSGLSVFPLAPVEIIWIIMVTSGMPDMGLGFERAVPDIMSRPPQSLEGGGIFDLEFLADMVFYGVWVAALCLAAFSLRVFAWGGGELGELCNDRWSPACDTVFRARATTFACLTWFALLLAWEMVDRRRSFFRMQPGSKRYLTQWAHDVWRNGFLFWAIMLGVVTMFPVLYIPVLADVVFKHIGITWEWGIVFVGAALFFAGVEGWKLAKRVYLRRAASRGSAGAGAVAWRDQDVEGRAFAEYMSFSVSEKTEKEG